MKFKIVIGLLSAALALSPVAAMAEGRTDPVMEMSYMAPMFLAPPTAFILDYPKNTVVAPSGKEKVVFRAPYGAKVSLMEKDQVDGVALWEGFGAGANPVTVPLPNDLAANEVHLLKLAMEIVEGVPIEIPLPPIVITSGPSIDIGLVSKIATGMETVEAEGWDFNGDGRTSTAADDAADLGALLHTLGPASPIELPTYENALMSFSLKSTVTSSTYSGTIVGNVVTVNLPFGTDLNDLTYGDSPVVSNGSRIVYTEPEPDFTGSVALRVVSPLGEERLYWVFANILPQFDLTAWTEETDSLWHVYDSSLNVKNQSVTALVYLPEGDGSDGYLPVSPFSGKSLWYGSSTVTGSVYAVGNYLGTFNDGNVPSEPDGGTSLGSHSGTIVFPEFTVPNEGSPKLSFWSWWEIESQNPVGFDLMNVSVLKDSQQTSASMTLNPTTYSSGSARLPYTSAGYNQAAVWKRYEMDMSAFKGQTVQIALNFDTGDWNYNGFRGWFVDQFYLGDNEVPSIATATLSASEGMLKAGYTGFSDANGDSAATAKYAWWISDDGTTWKRLSATDAALPVITGYQGKKVKVEIYPYDGKQYGNAAQSNVVDIPTLPPVS